MIKETACLFRVGKHSLTTKNTIPCLKMVAREVSFANQASGIPLMHICSNTSDWRNVKFTDVSGILFE
jgi:hypothetical protein